MAFFFVYFLHVHERPERKLVKKIGWYAGLLMAKDDSQLDLTG